MAKLFVTCICAYSIAWMATSSASAAGGRLRVVVNGAVVPAVRVAAIAVEGDTAGVDVATIALAAGSVPPAVGDDLLVDAVMGGTARSIFKGEIVGLEPSAAASGPVVLKAFNRLHRLTRGRKTRTFEKQSDADIARTIAKEAGLELGAASPEISIPHDHVFQHNQTDLEFLRARAALIGFEVWVDDRTLNLRRRPDAPEVAVGCAPTRDDRALLRLFHPKLAGNTAPSMVSVHGFNQLFNEEIVATAIRGLIPLSPGGADMKTPPGTAIDLGVVQALQDEAAAHGAAAGTLAALTKLDLAGEAETDGSPALHAGVRVSVQGADSRFNGAYYVTGVQHRYQKGSDDGYHTLLRLVRSDRGLFVLPEIGDEVLIAFEHGDLSRPFVVGSLWDSDERPPEESPACEGRRP